MIKNYIYLPLLLLCLLPSVSSKGQISSLVYYDADRNLVYKADEKGNTVPDFSYVGYKNGEAPIPTFPVVKTVSPVTGDNLANIQAAIDEVEKRKPDAKGIRGAVLLKKGEYRVEGTLAIEAGGIVLMGEGTGQDGTRIIATQRKKHDLILFRGQSGAIVNPHFTQKVKGEYLPIGARTFVVESGHSFRPGDRVMFQRKPNQKWIALLGMDKLKDSDPNDTNWSPSSYTVNYKRIVTKVDGNAITLDAPLVDPVEAGYAEAYLIKYDWVGRIENVGIENIRMISEFSNENDEEHGWDAVTFDNVENGWVRNIEAHHFGYSAVTIEKSSSNISVLDSKCIDPVSQTTGGRKYSFNVGGQRNLVKNCMTRGGRHDYVTGSQVAGPNVFVKCTAEDQKSNIGPHHRWATGLLFDNIVGNGSMDVENRRNSGSGHGWAGAQVMFWNCTANNMIVQDPPGPHVNWAVGNKANVTNKRRDVEFPLGLVEQTGKHVIPESLYEAQLAERLRNK